MKRIAVLDGWRGIAILLVLIDHVQDSLLQHFARPWLQTGQHGVTIFFVLSGFLITSKLVESKIDLRLFYTRRFFRLMPAAWVYLAVVYLLGSSARPPLVPLTEIRACLLFYRNFFTQHTATGLTGHFWSLSLEEQFYLVWPFVLLTAGKNRCRWAAAGGAVACAMYRWFFWAHYNRGIINGESQVRADAILAGCLLALLLDDERIRIAAARILKWCVLPAAGILIYCMVSFPWLPPLSECAAIACLIGATVLYRESVFARPLAWAPLAWCGTVSYSVYLWQQLFMPFRNPYAVLIAMPAAALGSYYLVERPFTNIGHRLTSSPKVHAMPPAGMKEPVDS